MSKVVGVVWFDDAETYLRALSIFTDSKDMPSSYGEWQSIARKECELIAESGNSVLGVDIDPEAFADWCASRGFVPNAQARIAFVDHVVLEFQKAGKRTSTE